MYFLPKAFNTAIVVIDRLPVTEATLWLRILGRDQVQAQAVTELLALPWDDSRRAKALQLLVNWRVTVEISGLGLDTGEEQLMVRLSQAYLEWEQRTEQRGRQEGRQEEARSLLLRQLAQKVGALPDRLSEQISTLNLEQLESLAMALLNFSTLADFEHWLEEIDRTVS
jgi:hypothetical protein